MNLDSPGNYESIKLVCFLIRFIALHLQVGIGGDGFSYIFLIIFYIEIVQDFPVFGNERFFPVLYFLIFDVGSHCVHLGS